MTIFARDKVILFPSSSSALSALAAAVESQGDPHRYTFLFSRPSTTNQRQNSRKKLTDRLRTVQGLYPPTSKSHTDPHSPHFSPVEHTLSCTPPPPVSQSSIEPYENPADKPRLHAAA
ncbi:unnamed protein product [Cyclocybe aegerita]|uniref:Uncharacterized protein n=1 Tax=Cyclocybe aegerita TaxID=1973307 RepID=A0A8S0XJC8_CYCAE|nr:unnamed protein product [Cyclocybe aegerita]